jgi:hypothetical protein
MQFVTIEEQLTEVKCGFKQKHGQLTIGDLKFAEGEEGTSFLPDFAW